MAKEREEQDELTWQAAESGACAQQRTAAACGGVQRYVGLFPQGRHAQEAQTLLSRLAPDPAQVAADPGGVRVDRARQAAAQAADDAAQKILEKLQADAAKAAEKAEQDARKAALKACVDACKKACEKDADCALTCTKEVCQ
jgi:hypothetical protein